ncbi:MAG: DAK2 domain-containing protein [Peptoniphilaceae bacterium]|nr:DAK2 domain-containing protein [Peptoniphilaceae bacterium]MDY6019402.1 DAK2 domain-containing protein [Anaerococcus sp.]
MREIDANELVFMINKAYEFLNENKDHVDKLNVFPVPDGDTGTNMTMTMKSGVEKVKSSDKSSIEDICKALSQGTLMGARGNSGVILSQLCRGMAKATKGKERIGNEEIKAIFLQAQKTSYKAVMKPTEGTILTVCRMMAEKASEAFNTDMDIEEYLYLIISAGQKALLNTPNQLPVLKEAGVVDSGGQGLMYLVEGALRALNEDFNLAEDIEIEVEKPKNFAISLEVFTDEQGSQQIKKSIDQLSSNPMYAYNKSIFKSDFEIDEIDNIADIFTNNAGLIKFEIKNINPDIDKKVKLMAKPKKKYGFIAVSRGEGYDKVFESLNVDKIIAGGQTMNPSTEDIFKAIDEINADNIIIFPNNKNIIMAAKQACLLSEKNCVVVETRSIPESFSAILTFDDSNSLEENLEDMKEVIEDLKVCEVSISIRDTIIGGLKIKKDDYIGIADGKIVASENSISNTGFKTLEKTVDNNTSLITIYYGQDISDREAKKFHKFISKKFKGVDVDLIYGGQPVYYYTITIE